jgi:hypothetical protein
MSGPIETTSLLAIGFAALAAALIVVPMKKDKPEPTETPPASSSPEIASRLDPVDEPPPAPDPSEDQRIMVLEQSVHEIKRDQQELKDEIRALTKELKAK